MKICEIIPYLYPLGGAERFLLNLSNSFFDQGDEIHIISLYKQDNNPVVNKLLDQKNIKIHFLNKKKGIDFKCAKELKKLIRILKPDVLHAHLDTLLTIWLSGINKTIKTFYTFHTLINTSVVGKKSKPKNVLYRMLFKHKKIYPIAISQIIKESICNYYNLESSFVDVVYNGVPIKQFSKSLSLLKREYDFIFIGRFIELKNPKIILSSFKKVLDIFPSANLVLIGEGPLLTDCIKYVDDFNIPNVEFKGFVEDVSLLLTNSKCLLLPSRYEGNPLVINEAIASKSYVIATCVGGIPDVVSDKNGCLINYDQDLENSLYKCMISFLGNTEAINALLESNYDNNSKMVSIERASKEYKHIFGGE